MESKNIDVKYHHAGEHIRSRTLVFSHFRPSEQIADIMKKALDLFTLEKHGYFF